MMTFRKALFIAAGLALGLAGTPTFAADAAPAASAYRDGTHDFDFNIGTWHTHIRTLQHPLSGSTSWAEMNGTVTVRKIWGG
jgi:hypothetical protein